MAIGTVNADFKNSEIGKIENFLGESWNKESVSGWANRMGVEREALKDVSNSGNTIFPASAARKGRQSVRRAGDLR